MARGINDEGQIVGYNNSVNTYGNSFLMDTNGTMYTIAIPGAIGTEVQGINDHGEIVGIYFDANHNANGFTTSVAAVEATAPALTLEDGTSVNGGTLTVNSGAMLHVEDAGATLDGVAVSGGGAIQVDHLTSSGPTTLTLDDDTSITGGTLTIGSAGELDVEAGSQGSGHGAALDGATVTNDGVIDVDLSDLGAVLTLGNTTIGGPGTITNDGTLKIAANSAATIGSDVAGTGAVQIDAGGVADFAGSFDQNVVFSGIGLLELGHSVNYDQTVSGYSDLAVLDLTDIKFDANTTTVTPNNSNTLLTVDDGSGDTANINIAGSYNTTWYTLSDGHLNNGNYGTLVVDPDVVVPSTGNAASGAEMVLFTDGTGTLTYTGSGGEIAGFTGTAPDAGHSDVIDLTGVNYDSGHFSDTYNSSTGLLTVTDGTNSTTLTLADFNGTLSFGTDGGSGTDIFDPPATNSAKGASVLSTATATATSDTVTGTLTFTDADSSDTHTVSVTPDGANYHGSFSLDPVHESNGSTSVGFEFNLGNDQINLTPGQTLTQSYDVSLHDAQNPAANANQTVSVAIGGDGNDNFVFQPGIGAETIANFNTHTDTIELDHFANAQTVQELSSLITTDAHGDAVIALGHNDSITVAGVSPTDLHQILASVVHLH